MTNLINKISQLPINVQKIELQTLIDIKAIEVERYSNCKLPFTKGLSKKFQIEIDTLTEVLNNL